MHGLTQAHGAGRNQCESSSRRFMCKRRQAVIKPRAPDQRRTQNRAVDRMGSRKLKQAPLTVQQTRCQLALGGRWRLLLVHGTHRPQRDNALQLSWADALQPGHTGIERPGTDQVLAAGRLIAAPKIKRVPTQPLRRRPRRHRSRTGNDIATQSLQQEVSDLSAGAEQPRRRNARHQLLERTSWTMREGRLRMRAISESCTCGPVCGTAAAALSAKRWIARGLRLSFQ